MNKEIDELLLKAEVGIGNAQAHIEVGSLLTVFGYTPEKLATGRGLLDNAKLLHQTQINEYGEKMAASDELYQARIEAHHSYINFVAIARVAFKNDPGMHTKLQINGKRKSTYSGWISQANVLYSNLISDGTALTKMTEFGVTLEKLQAGQALVENVEAKLAVQKKETGEAQDATKARDKAADELQEWYSDFIAIARIALQSHPQYLEMLGIVEPS